MGESHPYVYPRKLDNLMTQLCSHTFTHTYTYNYQQKQMRRNYSYIYIHICASNFSIYPCNAESSLIVSTNSGSHYASMIALSLLRYHPAFWLSVPSVVYAGELWYLCCHLLIKSGWIHGIVYPYSSQLIHWHWEIKPVAAEWDITTLYCMHFPC